MECHDCVLGGPYSAMHNDGNVHQHLQGEKMTIRVLINDEPYDFDEGASVADAIRYLQMSSGGLAVAMNGEVLPQKRWQDSKLADEDRIMLIRATHGG